MPRFCKSMKDSFQVNRRLQRCWWPKNIIVLPTTDQTKRTKSTKDRNQKERKPIQTTRSSRAHHRWRYIPNANKNILRRWRNICGMKDWFVSFVWGLPLQTNQLKTSITDKKGNLRILRWQTHPISAFSILPRVKTAWILNYLPFQKICSYKKLN